MLPLIVQSDQVFTFRFWLKDHIHEGLHYRGELFCCVQIFAASPRAKVYHLACKLERQGSPTLLLLSPTHCSLWISLRGSMVEKLLLRHIPPELTTLQPALPPASPPSSRESIAVRATDLADNAPLDGGNGRSSFPRPQTSLPAQGVEVTP